jgi:hypothetical protein
LRQKEVKLRSNPSEQQIKIENIIKQLHDKESNAEKLALILDIAQKKTRITSKQFIPTSIFSKEISTFESAVKFLKDEHKLCKAS